jgi:hypothetical protein
MANIEPVLPVRATPGCARPMSRQITPAWFCNLRACESPHLVHHLFEKFATDLNHLVNKSWDPDRDSLIDQKRMHTVVVLGR